MYSIACCRDVRITSYRIVLFTDFFSLRYIIIMFIVVHARYRRVTLSRALCDIDGCARETECRMQGGQRNGQVNNGKQ